MGIYPIGPVSYTHLDVYKRQGVHYKKNIQLHVYLHYKTYIPNIQINNLQLAHHSHINKHTYKIKQPLRLTIFDYIVFVKEYCFNLVLFLCHRGSESSIKPLIHFSCTKCHLSTATNKVYI